MQDYIRFIADSMMVDLTNDRVNELTHWAIENEHYRTFLDQLEIQIGKDRGHLMYVDRRVIKEICYDRVRCFERS